MCVLDGAVALNRAKGELHWSCLFPPFTALQFGVGGPFPGLSNAVSLLVQLNTLKELKCVQKGRLSW